MPELGELRIYQVRVHGCTSEEEQFAVKEPIARTLCPDEWHASPCPVPWGFGVADDDLALGILATPYTALEVTGWVRSIVGETRTVSLHRAAEDEFPELLEQYHAEHGLS